MDIRLGKISGSRRGQRRVKIGFTKVGVCVPPPTGLRASSGSIGVSKAMPTRPSVAQAIRPLT